MMVRLFDIDPDGYLSHPLHADSRSFAETNCYADIVIELLHARGDEPTAALGRSVRTDFEGDQWTFFKPDPHDLETLFGLDIHEVQPYRSLPEQIAEQISDGRTLIIELDSWYLPDTRATAYRREHVKSSAAMAAIDVGDRRLHYFHNRGLYALEGDDFDAALRLQFPVGDDHLPPYVELVRFDAGARLTGEELKEECRRLLGSHLRLAPRTNPFARFAASLETALPRLLEQSHEQYHAYAFATVRMVGASFELCSSYVDWLFDHDAATARDRCDAIVAGAKALSFKFARRKPFDVHPLLTELGRAWDEAMESIADLAA
jgi:uncharacterized protein DUF1839